MSHADSLSPSLLRKIPLLKCHILSDSMASLSKCLYTNMLHLTMEAHEDYINGKFLVCPLCQCSWLTGNVTPIVSVSVMTGIATSIKSVFFTGRQCHIHNVSEL